jgi:hypothetical protein
MNKWELLALWFVVGSYIGLLASSILDLPTLYVLFMAYFSALFLTWISLKKFNV